MKKKSSITRRSLLDDFLQEDEILEETRAAALKQVERHSSASSTLARYTSNPIEGGQGRSTRPAD